MSKVGGYQILDLSGVALEDKTAGVVKGAYDALKYSGGKAILVSGLNLDGADISDRFGYSAEASGTYTIVAPGFTAVVAEGDAVTVTVDPT